MDSRLPDIVAQHVEKMTLPLGLASTDLQGRQPSNLKTLPHNHLHITYTLPISALGWKSEKSIYPKYTTYLQNCKILRTVSADQLSLKILLYPSNIFRYEKIMKNWYWSDKVVVWFKLRCLTHPSDAKILTRATTCPGLGFLVRALPITRPKQGIIAKLIHISHSKSKYKKNLPIQIFLEQPLPW